MKTSIWWIRRDVRLIDNRTLSAALTNADQVIPVFILDPKLMQSDDVGEKRLAFLFANLHCLNTSLVARGSRLILRQGQPLEELATLIQESGAREIYAEPDYSPYATQRDQTISSTLPVNWIGSPAVHPPGSVLNATGRPYTVYTPFSRSWKTLPMPIFDTLIPAPDRIPTPAHLTGLLIPHLLEHPAKSHFPPGEAEAQRRLQVFTAGLDPAVYRYGAMRNREDLDGTSGLSPYFRFGVLSARQATVAALFAIQAAPNAQARQSAETWLNELIWREFYIHILFHFPEVRRHNFRLQKIAWQNDPDEFLAWCEGRTGYPGVDAAMRQLVATGWMHNRARMIVASFLTKDLLIDWRWGERFFMQHLLDGDPAANNGGWQWTAGTGTDAAPYFRIFNPVSQSRKFDPEGEYIRRWLPELAQVPGEYINETWKMPIAMQLSISCVIGKDYPAPIVDHHWARERALLVYRQGK